MNPVLTRFLLALALAIGCTAPALAQVDTNYNTPVDVTAVSVTATATNLLSGVAITSGQRYKGFWLNPTNGQIAVGGRSVTTATGALVESGEKVFINWSYGQNWYAIRTGASSVNVRIVPVK